MPTPPQSDRESASDEVAPASPAPEAAAAESFVSVNDSGSNDTGANDTGANDSGANDSGANDSGAGDAVADAYERLRSLAGAMLRGQGAGHTLQPTAVVHEVYLRLAQEREAPERDREHLLALAARAMRQVLIDHARSRGAAKRGGDWQRVDLTLEHVSGGASREVSLVDLNDALDRLEALSERQARVVELRCFGGLSVPEVARVLGASPRTVDNDWRIARAWLRAELEPADRERSADRQGQTDPESRGR